jgi:transcriptional regulator with XRE-family HTH domain
LDKAEKKPSEVSYLEQGKALKRLRNQVGLSQSELAKAANVALSTLVKLERGERVPGHDIKQRLATALQAASASASASAAIATISTAAPITDTAIGNTEGDVAQQLLAIDWPTPYSVQSYNYRKPNSAPQGSSGARLKELRLAKGLSQAQVALQLGLPEHKFARLERGNAKIPDPKMLKALSAVLGEEVYTIFPSSSAGSAGSAF